VVQEPNYATPVEGIVSKHAVVVIDWTSLLFAVRRMALPVLLRSIYLQTRDLGISSVVRVVMLMDPDGPFAEVEPNNAREVEADCAALYVERCSLSWIPRPVNSHEARRQPWELRPNCLTDLCGRMNASSDLPTREQETDPSVIKPVLVFVSSRPHPFVGALNFVLSQRRQILLMHAHGKQPHALPHETTMQQRPPTSSQAFAELQEGDSARRPNSWLYQRTVAARAILADAWGVVRDNQWQLDECLCAHFHQLIGVLCVWDLPVWVEHEEQYDSLPGRSPASAPAACPYWNSGRPCPPVRGGAACPPHLCQGCGGLHPLTHCPVNTLLIPPENSEALHAPIRARMQVFLSPTASDASFVTWFHRSLKGVFSRRETIPILPHDALVFVDWQNVHVPLSEVERFLNALKYFGCTKGKAEKVRKMYVLLDGRAVSDVATTMDRLARESVGAALQVVSIEARKVQMLDSVLQRMLRLEPRPCTETRGADDVVVVSGDADFSPDMSRLVQLGHPLLLVHNTQARVGFKTNPMWDVRQDYMLLPQMAAYHSMKMEQRAERKREKHTALSRGITTRVITVQPSDGDLGANVPGIFAACMDVDGSALLITDSVQDLVWRLSLPRNKNSSAHASSAGGASTSAAACELRLCSLEVLAGCGPSFAEPVVHYVICINSSAAMADLWGDVIAPLYKELRKRLQKLSHDKKAPDMVSVFTCNDTVLPLQPHALTIDDMPDLPSTPCAGDLNTQQMVLTVQQLLSHGYGSQRQPAFVEVLLITDPVTVTDSTHALLCDIIALDHAKPRTVTIGSYRRANGTEVAAYTRQLPQQQTATGAGESSSSTTAQLRARCSVWCPSELLGHRGSDFVEFANLIQSAEAIAMTHTPVCTMRLPEGAQENKTCGRSYSLIQTAPGAPACVPKTCSLCKQTCCDNCWLQSQPGSGGGGSVCPSCREPWVAGVNSYLVHKIKVLQQHLAISPCVGLFVDAVTTERERMQILTQTARPRSTNESTAGSKMSSVQFCRPTEIVMDATSQRVFVLDSGAGRIVVLDRDYRARVLTLADSNSQLSVRPRFLCMDSQHQRLWFTDMQTQQMCFYSLPPSNQSGTASGLLEAQLHRVQFIVDDRTGGEGEGASSAHAAGRRSVYPVAPASKCIAANGRDLVFCDEALKAFFVLKSEAVRARVSSSNSGSYVFSAPVYQLCPWRQSDAHEAMLASLPVPTYHSLVLDRDGSYLFADSTTHTIKRLVAVRDDKATPSGSQQQPRWHVSLVAGKGQGGLVDGEAREAKFKFPAALLPDHNEPGAVFICEQGNHRLRKLVVAREVDAANANFSSAAAGEAGKSSGVPQPHLRMRAHFKTRPCKHFQKGTCMWMAESDKCSFLHQCSRCGGPHGEPQCEHRAFTDQHSYMTLHASSEHGPGGTVAARAPKEAEYHCHICHSLVGPLNIAKQHIASTHHQKKLAAHGWQPDSVANSVREQSALLPVLSQPSTPITATASANRPELSAADVGDTENLFIVRYHGRNEVTGRNAFAVVKATPPELQVFLRYYADLNAQQPLSPDAAAAPFSPFQFLLCAGLAAFPFVGPHFVRAAFDITNTGYDYEKNLSVTKSHDESSAKHVCLHSCSLSLPASLCFYLCSGPDACTKVQLALDSLQRRWHISWDGVLRVVRTHAAELAERSAHGPASKQGGLGGMHLRKGHEWKTAVLLEMLDVASRKTRGFSIHEIGSQAATVRAPVFRPEIPPPDHHPQPTRVFVGNLPLTATSVASSRNAAVSSASHLVLIFSLRMACCFLLVQCARCASVHFPCYACAVPCRPRHARGRTLQRMRVSQKNKNSQSNRVTSCVCASADVSLLLCVLFMFSVSLNSSVVRMRCGCCTMWIILFTADCYA